ncbi:MAG: CNNM domain-containing protein, partial [Cyanobium sp.]
MLILANGLFGGTELAIVSSSRHRLEQLAQQGRRSARVALRLGESPNQFLSTVQIGITLIGIHRCRGRRHHRRQAGHAVRALAPAGGLQRTPQFCSGCGRDHLPLGGTRGAGAQ